MSPVSKVNVSVFVQVLLYYSFSRWEWDLTLSAAVWQNPRSWSLEVAREKLVRMTLQWDKSRWSLSDGRPFQIFLRINWDTAKREHGKQFVSRRTSGSLNILFKACWQEVIDHSCRHNSPSAMSQLPGCLCFCFVICFFGDCCPLPAWHIAIL